MDVLLVGDSITQQWGSPLDKGILNAAWMKHFGGHKTLNIGIGGDKGIQPRLIVVMIGNNNMFFTAETGIEAAAKGVTACVENVRAKFPKAEVIVAKILPAHAPGNNFYEDIKKTNANGTIKPALFKPDNIHLSLEGYKVYAERLKPLIERIRKVKPTELLSYLEGL